MVNTPNVNTAFVSIVVPVDNPDVDVRSLFHGYTRPLFTAGYDCEVIFVLDGVHGRLVDELEELQQELPVQFVRLQGEGLGESIALSAGAAKARGGFIVNGPAYLQCEPDDIVKLVQAMESGADLVSTWRYPRIDPWLNRVQSRLFNWILRVVMGVRFHDLNSSVRAMRRQVVEQVNVYGEMFRFLPVLAQRQGFNVVEVKVRHREEQGRQGFYGIGVYVRRVLDILAITFLTRFTQKPLRFFGMLGVVAMLVGIALCVNPIYDKLSGQAGLSDRPIFVLGAILVAFGVQLIGFGLVGEIIIFTQASHLRDYKIEELLEGGAPGGAGGTDPDADTLEGGSGEAGGVEPEATAAPSRRGDGGVGRAGGAGTNGSLQDLPLRARELLPGEDARWDSFVREHPQGTFFHLSGWRRVVEETFGHDPHYLVVEEGRSWVGVLPMFWVKSPFIGRHLISVPYGVYGGLLARSTDAPRPSDAAPGVNGVQAALLDGACQLGRRLKVGYLELRHMESRPGDRQRIDLYQTFRMELPDDPDEVMPAIPKKARAEVRRARDRFGMTFGVLDDIAVFYELFSREKHRLGTPSLPLRWFKNLRDEFGRQIVMHVVRDPDGEAIAAVLSFLFKGVIYAYYSGSAPSARGSGVSDFVYCKIMEWGVENGYRTFDFGRSRRDTGAAKFKRNMGFEPTDLNYEFVMLKDGAQLPDFHPSNPKLERPRRLWTKLPPFVANRVGGKLSRYLP